MLDFYVLDLIIFMVKTHVQFECVVRYDLLTHALRF